MSFKVSFLFSERLTQRNYCCQGEGERNYNNRSWAPTRGLILHDKPAGRALACIWQIRKGGWQRLRDLSEVPPDRKHLSLDSESGLPAVCPCPFLPNQSNRSIRKRTQACLAPNPTDALEGNHIAPKIRVGKQKRKRKESLKKIKVAQWNHAGFWRLSLHRLFNWCILRVRLDEEEERQCSTWFTWKWEEGEKVEY